MARRPLPVLSSQKSESSVRRSNQRSRRRSVREMEYPMKRFVLVTAILSLSAVASNLAFDDWPQWRGPNRDGISGERGLLKDWPAAGPPVVWRATGAGTGYSSFSAANGRLYTLGARHGTEYLMAYAADSGKKLW